MEYIANTSNSAINTISQVFVVEVKDTDELVDKNNVEYIQNANLTSVSLNGEYQVISEDEAAEVNDMLQYWGSIHMFGTEIKSVTERSLLNSDMNSRRSPRIAILDKRGMYEVAIGERTDITKVNIGTAKVV